MAKRDLHRAGGKFAGSHSTVLDGAVDVIDAAAKMPCVKKITLAIIENGVRKPSGQLKVKCMDAPNLDTALRVTMAKGGSIQTVYMYVEKPGDRQTLRTALEAFSC